MPKIYLSPSLQPGNQTVLGVSEQYLMNLIADAIEPLLQANGIEYVRNRIGMTLNQIIAESNAQKVDAHIAIHSNAAPLPGTARGSRMYYFTTAQDGKRLAQNMADEFSQIYPDPSRVGIVPTTSLVELSQTRAPALIVETAFHDNQVDANWIQVNIQNIALAIVRAIVKYFGMSFIAPCTQGTQPAENFSYNGFIWGKVCTQHQNLNLRDAPNGNILFTLSPSSNAIVTGATKDGWTPVRYNFWDGFVASRFFCICIRPPVRPVPPIGILPECPKCPICPPVNPLPPIGEICPECPICPPPIECPQCPECPPVICPEPYMATVRTHGNNLNLRSAPSTDAAIIDRIPNFSRILVLRQEGDWLYVFWNNQLGWVNSNYVAR